LLGATRPVQSSAVVQRPPSQAEVGRGIVRKRCHGRMSAFMVVLRDVLVASCEAASKRLSRLAALVLLREGKAAAS